MDNKKLILAVAGSGKTYLLVNSLNETERFLLITYTISGTENLIREVIERFGYHPNNIKIYNYFSFLYSFCYKPFFKDEIKDKGIYWKYPSSVYDNSFLTKGNFLYHNRISKLLLQKVDGEVRNRLTRYFDHLFIDEIQDFGGNDFDLIVALLKTSVNMVLVGDFYQHTFDTSKDKQKNKSLHHNYNNYLSRFEKSGIVIDSSTLIKSRRCSKAVCDFIKEKLGIDIESENNRITRCELIADQDEAEQIIRDDSYMKLFLLKHYNYECKSDNWGACKGLTFDNVCVVLNADTLKLFSNPGLFLFKSAITQNKFYVACSRAKGNLVFVSDKHLKSFKK